MDNTTKMLKLEMPTLKEVLEEVGGNEQLLEEHLERFRLWLKQQLHLPQEISDRRLKHFICTAKFDLERAKKRFDTHYTLRNMIPEIFSKFDPLCDSITRLHEAMQCISLPKLPPEKYRIVMVRYLNPDSSLFDIWAALKYSFLTLDWRIERDIVNSNVIIIDCTNFSIGHALKCTPNVVKSFDLCVETYGMRIKGIYVINVPRFFDIIMTIAKAVMKSKLFNRIHLYTSGIESLYEIIPKSLFPSDYGGEQPPMDALAGMWREKLAEQRKWFLKQEKLTANESLRSNSMINPHDLFGAPGTFRKLETD